MAESLLYFWVAVLIQDQSVDWTFENNDNDNETNKEKQWNFQHNTCVLPCPCTVIYTIELIITTGFTLLPMYNTIYIYNTIIKMVFCSIKENCISFACLWNLFISRSFFTDGSIIFSKWGLYVLLVSGRAVALVHLCPWPQVGEAPVKRQSFPAAPVFLDREERHGMRKYVLVRGAWLG